MRKLISVIAIFLVVGILYFFNKQSPTLSNDLNPESKTNHGSQSSPFPKKLNPNGLANTDATVAKAALATAPELQKWILSESVKLNDPHVDTKQKELELKKLVENFSVIEKKVVLDTAVDIKRTANERILAIYILTLDLSAGSESNLSKIAQKALPDFGPVNAHSEAEIRRGQELAGRYMALDELAKRAKSSPEALELIKKLAGEAESAEVRSYAQRILKEMK